MDGGVHTDMHFIISNSRRRLVRRRFHSKQGIASTFVVFLIHDNVNMHTAWVRLNAVVFFGLTVLLGLSILTALSTYLHQGKSLTVSC